MLLRVADFLIFPLQFFFFFFCLLSLLFATFVCHWAAHIAVAVVINGPTKAEDVSRWWWWWRWYDDSATASAWLAWLTCLACHLNGIYAAKPGPECPSPACCRRHSTGFSCIFQHQLSNSNSNCDCKSNALSSIAAQLQQQLAKWSMLQGKEAKGVNAAKLRRRSTKP